jgi:hypothetical protein
MKALISPIELRQTGFRVAQIADNQFDVAPPFFWVDCSNDVKADQFWYDPSDETIKPNLQDIPQDITEA